MDVAEVEVWDSVGPDRLPGLLERCGSAGWAAGRSADDVSRMLAGSDVVLAVGHRETGRMLGFARVLTDGVYLAVVLDVVVAPAAARCGGGAVVGGGGG